MKYLLPLLAIAACSSSAMAQSNVSTTNKFAWGENVGWINFRDANAGVQGVTFNAYAGRVFSGYAWGENIGWINFGDGTPTNGVTYANTTGADFGVNYDPATDQLSGFAWGENIGWINFTLPGIPAASQPRYDSANKRIKGYAWGENIGWINLDIAVAGQFVAFDVRCSPADIADGTGEPLPPFGIGGFNPLGPDGGDFDCFFNFYFEPAPNNAVCDIAYGNGEPLPPFGVPGGFNPGVDGGDFDCFFNFYFNGCL